MASCDSSNTNKLRKQNKMLHKFATANFATESPNSGLERKKRKRRKRERLKKNNFPVVRNIEWKICYETKGTRDIEVTRDHQSNSECGPR